MEEIEFLGVREIVDENQLAATNALVSTALICTLLFFVEFMPPALGVGPYLFPHKNQFVEWATLCGLIFWCVQFLCFRYCFGTTITTNSELGYHNLRDLILSGAGGSRYARVNRDIGQLIVSEMGLGGLVTVPWSSIQNVDAAGSTRALIEKIATSKLLKRSGMKAIILDFSSESDLHRFLECSNSHIAKRILMAKAHIAVK